MAIKVKTPKAPKSAPIVAPIAPELSPEQVAAQAAIRKDELSTARKCYLSATLGARSHGGSDLVGRALRALNLIPSADFVSVDQLIIAMGAVDNAALLEWAKTHIAGLVDSKANARRIAAFGEFVAANGFARMALALTTFRNHRAWNFSETIRNPKTGTSMTYTVDCVRELSDLFALRTTNSRRARWGVMA